MAQNIVIWGTKDLNTSAQIVLAKRLGLFKYEGLDVQCKLFPDETKLAAAFHKAADQPLLWAQTVPELLRFRTAGIPAQILAPLADISASYQVIVRDNAGIVLPAELEDRSVGIVRGSLIEVALHNMAKDFGVDLARVNFVDAPPVKQLELFVNAEIDAIACWEPWTSQARYVGGRFYFSGLHSMIPGHEGNINWLTGQSMLVTRKDTIQQQTSTLISLLKTLKKATDYLNTTRSKAAGVLSDLLGMEDEELVTLLQKNLYTMTMDNLFQIGLVSVCDAFPHKAATSDLYVTYPLQQVDASLVQVTPPDTASEGESEIVAEGNIYYPGDARIQHTGDEPLRYIIVDDTNVVIELFSEIVEMLNGEVVGTASTGTEAMIQYIDLLPDVVAMDISMPDMDGIEAVKRILTINPDANVLIISGNNYAETRREVFELGVKAFIGKPFHIDQIVAVLSKLIGP